MTTPGRPVPLRATPIIGLCIAAFIAIGLALPTPAAAQRKRSGIVGKTQSKSKAKAKAKASNPAKAKPVKSRRGKRKRGKTKTFDFTGIDLVGRLRSPQLLYFLDRVSQELELASLEQRSFIPEMVRSLDQEDL